MSPEAFVLAGLGAINAVLVAVVGFLVKHELHDVKMRIVRIENLLFLKKGMVSSG